MTDLVTGANLQSSSTSTIINSGDGLQKRQLYTYGGHSLSNVTTSTAHPTVFSATGTAVENSSITNSQYITGTETETGIFTTVSSLQSAHQSAITRTMTSETNLTVTSSTQTVGSTTYLTETASSASLTTGSTTQKGASASTTTSNGYVSTVTRSTDSLITNTILVTVAPYPVTTNGTVPVAAVSGPSATLTSGSGGNLTMTSTMIRSGTIFVTITTAVGGNSSCTEYEASTLYSNDAVSATMTTSTSELSSTSQPSTGVSPTPASGSTTPSADFSTSTDTCTDVESSTIIPRPTSSDTEIVHITLTQTVYAYGSTTTPTGVLTTSTKHSAHGLVTPVGDPTTTSGTTTIVSTTVRTSTMTVGVKSSTTVTDSCTPAPTVTVTATVVQTVTAITSNDAISAKEVPASETGQSSTVPEISISPNTTVTLTNPGHKKTMTVTTNVLSTSSMNVTSHTTPGASSSSSKMSHHVSDVSSYSRFVTSNGTFHTVGLNGTGMTTSMTGTAGTTLYSTQTVMANHTGAAIPSRPVSAGARRMAGPMGGGDGQGSSNPPVATGGCVMMLVAILALLTA
ncbi:hypothetical protein PFICI_03429 [Pestalotiopsis fici W106-1]|uniref:Uncharacterized protein n=1 Tax=Pestalotiopsis fici (strain W106-1 / CGMCC3.15140) TaxID=1229662 RepID=W3XHD5_PESFW|nr:uncharacterized protein PFICI_03429 [Pestalotiopsis fici W106-1]ETS85404.1 hypothetical protein PFICI_03429 [Pestalotiopsis fici W106-1]